MAKGQLSPIVLTYEVDEWGMPISPPPESTINYRNSVLRSQAGNNSALRGSAPGAVKRANFSSLTKPLANTQVSMGFVNYVNGVPVSVEVGAGEEKFVKTLTNAS